MQDRELESIVTEYSKVNLSPTETERSRIAARYDQLHRFLSGRLPADWDDRTPCAAVTSVRPLGLVDFAAHS